MVTIYAKISLVWHQKYNHFFKWQITKNLKFLLFERYLNENEKTRQRLGYSICKSYIVSDKGLDSHSNKGVIIKNLKLSKKTTQKINKD